MDSTTTQQWERRSNKTMKRKECKTSRYKTKQTRRTKQLGQIIESEHRQEERRENSDRDPINVVGPTTIINVCHVSPLDERGTSPTLQVMPILICRQEQLSGQQANFNGNRNGKD